jgi:hypothetical protein
MSGETLQKAEDSYVEHRVAIRQMANSMALARAGLKRNGG